MVNLLFISSSAKINSIKNTLQPLLKVKIDVVADFDYGLKDVFEKRPATVFIQDQIAGVTGESVARHIQMLLGAGSPSFIYMHEGSLKAKPIKGLFEHLIDLSQADVKIVADIQAILKSLLGPQWEKIYSPPKNDNLTVNEAVSVLDGHRAFADKRVDDFLSDLVTSGETLATSSSPLIDFSDSLIPADVPFNIVSSAQDQLAEMVSETQKMSDIVQTAAVKADEIHIKKTTIPVPEPLPVQDIRKQIVPNQSEAVEPEVVSAAQVRPVQKVNISVAPVTVSAADTADDFAVNTVSVNSSPQYVSVADFVIHGEKQPEEVAPEELLRVFEGNYSQSSGSWKRYIALTIAVTVCAVVVIWLVLKQKPYLLPGVIRTSGKPQLAAPATKPIQPDVAVSKPDSQSPEKVEALSLPTFIPLTGLDRSFASQKPGWERYIDTTLDFRIYRSSGKIKALQVLGIKNHDISESKLKSILMELLGDGEYRVMSREQKLGYTVSRATAGKNAELLMYRKKSSLRAFVIALD